MVDRVVSLAELISRHRRRLQLTQEQLAERSGLSVRAIRDLERGRVRAPRWSSVRLLADALDLDADARTGLETASAESSPGVPPALLPLDVAGFAGREDHLARLDALLDGSTAWLICAVSGTAGVGKTALAVHWAHRVRERFPDGQLYVNLRGADPSGSVMQPIEAVRIFLDALDVPPQRVPAGLPAQVGLYRSLLADRRVLVVLDNARDADQVRPLLPGTAGARVVVTSRNQLMGLIATEGALPVPLDLLSGAEARALLNRRLGVQRVGAEPGAVDEIIARCARLPLALAIVAARAATHPAFPLASLADELGHLRGPLDMIVGDDADTDLRAVLSWSYKTVSAGAAELFRLLGLHAGPDISLAATVSLAGSSHGHVRTALTELVLANLVTERLPGRYHLHDLLRAYATELCHAHDSQEQRRAALHRLLDHYAHTASAANRLLAPHREPIVLHPPVVPGTAPEGIADRTAALTWLNQERAALVRVIKQASAAGLDTSAFRLASVLVDFFDVRSGWHDLVVTQHVALDASRRLHDRQGEGRAHCYLAQAYTAMGRFDEATDHLHQALRLFDQLDDLRGQGDAHMHLDLLFWGRGQTDEALDHAQQALRLYRAADHHEGQAVALNGIGYWHAAVGDSQAALDHCARALAINRKIGNSRAEAQTSDSLAYAHRRRGDHAQAAHWYRRAITLFRQVGDRYNEAESLTNLGDTHHAACDHTAAHQAWQSAAAILDALNHPRADQIRARLPSHNGQPPQSTIDTRG